MRNCIWKLHCLNAPIYFVIICYYKYKNDWNRNTIIIEIVSNNNIEYSTTTTGNKHYFISQILYFRNQFEINYMKCSNKKNRAHVHVECSDRKNDTAQTAICNGTLQRFRILGTQKAEFYKNCQLGGKRKLLELEPAIESLNVLNPDNSLDNT